jgi:hypothetical protein
MKNKLRSEKRGSKSAATSQPKTAPSKALHQAVRGKMPHGLLPFDPEEDHPSCLCVYDRSPGGGVVSQIPLSSDEFSRLLTAGLSNDPSLEQFVAVAIREKLSKASNGPAAPQLGKKLSPVDAEIQKLVAILRSSTGEKNRKASRRLQALCKQELDRLRREAGRPWTITCVWFMPDGSEWVRVEFEREVFVLIKRAAAKLGISLQKFFDNAIRAKIDSRDNRRAA